jgi:hypothetical protein
MPNKFMSDPTVQKYYKQWVSLPTFFTGHPLDEKRFHKFVRASVEYAKTKEIDTEKLDIETLRSNLTDAFAKQGINSANSKDRVSKFIIRFQDITWYEATKLD